MNIALDFNQDESYPEIAAQWLDIDRTYFGDCATITVWSGGKISAIVVYSSFNNVNCEVSVASTSKWWARKQIIDILFKFPFEQLGCKRITLLIRETNHLTLRLAERLGFSREGCLRHFYHDGMNCIIYGILKSELEKEQRH